jgi:hypothetical protein
MKARNKNSEDKHDPLAEELNFDKLELVTYGPGWKKVSARVRSPKHLREAKAKLARKPALTKSRGRRAA